MRRLFSVVTLASLAAAMALAAVPWSAAATVETETNFNVKIIGPSPLGETLQLVLKTGPGAGQVLLFCAPDTFPRLQGPILPCQGGGRVYDIGLSAPAGTQGSYRFERVSADGAIAILRQGTFITRYGGPLASQEQTFNVTYSVTTLPNAATTPRPEVGVSGSILVGILMLLLATTVLGGSVGRRFWIRKRNGASA
jgi:hypothetical protein